MPPFIRAMLEAFLARDYRADIGRLNVALAAPGRAHANLCHDMVPVPYTGDPFSAERGACIALLGINPRWPAGGWASHHGVLEHVPLRSCADRYRGGEPAAATEFFGLRHGYFLPNSRIYYWRYFSKLGNRLSEQWFPGLPTRAVFRQRVFKADVLPYFSNDADSIGTDELVAASGRDAALIAYQRALAAILVDRHPRWIQCNGLAAGVVIEALYGIGSFETMEVFDAKGRPFKIRVGWARVHDGGRALDVRVLVHGFTNAPKGPQDRPAWGAIAAGWLAWHGDPDLVSF